MLVVAGGVMETKRNNQIVVTSMFENPELMLSLLN